MMFRVIVAGAALALAMPAAAASLLTSSAGYTGPELNLSGYNAFFTFTDGPVSLPGGITYASTDNQSVIGKGGYGLADNGSSLNALIIGTNSGSATITLTFDNAVSSFGAGMNYAVFGSTPDGANPTIAAFDSLGGLIASYDLFSLAPISTPGGLDAFMFRGIDGGGIGIKSFTLSGSYLIAQGSGAVPEPASWAMLIAGFGLTGAALRRRRAVIA